MIAENLNRLALELLNRIVGVKECDARMFNSNTKAG